MSRAEAAKNPVVDMSIRPRAGLPRHFHLLWDEDLEEMREIFSRTAHFRSNPWELLHN